MIQQSPSNTGVMPEKIPGVWGLAPKGALTNQSGIRKSLSESVLTKLKTVADPFTRPKD